MLHDYHGGSRRLLRTAPFCGWVMAKPKRETYDLVTVCTVLLLYCANRFLCLFEGLLPNDFLLYHFNDLCAGILFPAYANLVCAFFKVRFRFEGPLVGLILGCLCSVFWEGLIPFLNSRSTADFYDCVCYVAGVQIYVLFRHAVVKSFSRKAP